MAHACSWSVRTTILILGIGTVLLPFSACALDTTGDKFRDFMADVDARCKREKRGPYLDKSDPEYRSKVRDTSCDILQLRPRDWRQAKFVTLDSQHFPIPEHWLSTPEGEFAHSIKLPAPHDKARNLYKRGMGAAEYFEVLCREEAGEFVFRTVQNVEVLFEARPRALARSPEFFHLFSMEDPYGYTYGETSNQIGATWTSGHLYRALERKTSGSLELVFRQSIRERTVNHVAIALPAAEYVFTWRGVTRPQDRESGIAGGELIVLDRKTNEVLGFRRGFVITGIGKRGVSWEFAHVCPQYGFRGGRSKDFDFGLWFVSRILQPPKYEKYREEITGR